MEIWKRSADPGTRRHESYAALEARCRRADVEVWSAWMLAAGVQTCRHKGMELWSSGGAMQA